jgi:hypothetical protein
MTRRFVVSSAQLDHRVLRPLGSISPRFVRSDPMTSENRTENGTPTTKAGRALLNERVDTENGTAPLIPFPQWVTAIEAEARQQERERLREELNSILDNASEDDCTPCFHDTLRALISVRSAVRSATGSDGREAR